MQDLADRKCAPCEGGVDPLDEARARDLLGMLHADWQLTRDSTAIEREFRYKAYYRTMSFDNPVAYVATNEGHNPQVNFSYCFCRDAWWTQAIGGLADK